MSHATFFFDFLMKILFVAFGLDVRKVHIVDFLPSGKLKLLNCEATKSIFKAIFQSYQLK